jgi:hypothetical protein
MCRPSIFLGCLFFFYLTGTLGEQCGNVYRIARVYIGSRFRLCLHTVPFCPTQETKWAPVDSPIQFRDMGESHVICLANKEPMLIDKERGQGKTLGSLYIHVCPTDAAAAAGRLSGARAILFLGRD